MHQFGAGTHVGNVRDNNEDSYVCDADRQLWIVADGMGGLGFGEVASAISAYTIQSQVKDGHGINQAIELAHNRIKEFSILEAKGTNIGTTLVLLLSQGSLYNIFWVGDSRAYMFDQTLRQLTVDHSLVQSLIDQGELTPEEAEFDPRKNAVTRALGVQELDTVRADSISDKWQPNQKILLCSDGLTDCVNNQSIEAIMSQEGSDQAKVDELIHAALKNGGKDNITVLIISAPQSISRVDSDTHVPGYNDATHVPSDPNAMQKSLVDVQQVNSVQTQLEFPLQDDIPLLIDQISPAQDPGFETHPSQIASQVALQKTTSRIRQTLSNWFDWQRGLIASTIVVSMVLFAQLTTADRTDYIDSPFTTGELVQPSASHIPLTRRDIPEIAFPSPGSVIQVGIYSKLKGAETKQSDLIEFGLLAHVEKTPTGQGMLYAVLLGPFHDVKSHKQTTEKLKAKGLSYFERAEENY